MTDLENFYNSTVLPQFTLPEGDIRWQGHGQLGIDSSLHYFELGNKNYLLIFEDHPSDKNDLVGNAVAPHESLRRIAPKDTSYSDVYIQGEDNKYIPDMTGTFTLYRIFTPEQLAVEFHNQHN